MIAKKNSAFAAFTIALALLASPLLPAQDNGKPICDHCVHETLAELLGAEAMNIHIGECPSCKAGDFMRAFQERICEKCATKRRVCARCLIARGWNKDLNGVPRSAKNRIVFLSNRVGNNELYSMKPDGKDVQRLTEADSNELDPAVSKDGRWIAFGSNRDGNWEIYMADGKGSNLRRLTRSKESENHPSWFPDGKRLVAVQNSGGHRLVLIDLIGGKPVPLDIGENLATGFPEVSGDGKRIVFVGSSEAAKPGALELYVWEMADSKNPGKGSLKRLTNNECVDSYPSFSPDGKKIAFVSNRNGDDDIFVMNVDGSKTKCIVRRKGLDTLPWFSPDGRKVAYVSLLDPEKGIKSTEIFTINLTGKRKKRITKNDWKETTFRWR